MEKRLLFVNHSKEEINDFLRAVPHGKYLIDVAEDGYDAGILMKKNDYGVVVLDMYVKGYDGEQIIKYISHMHPDTICIVYTYNLNRGQLVFLLNTQNVFSIFLSPGNFSEEIIPAVEEAFLIHKMKVAQKNSDTEVMRQFEDNEKNILEKSGILNQQQRKIGQFLTFSEELIVETTKMSNLKSAQEKEELIQYERGLLYETGQSLEFPCNTLEELKNRLEEEFGKDGQCREFQFEYKCSEQEEHSKSTLGTLYASLWILLRMYGGVSKENGVEIQIFEREEGLLTVSMRVILPRDIWERGNQELEELGEKRQIVESGVEEMVEFCDRQIMGNEIRYLMKVRNPLIEEVYR